MPPSAGAWLPGGQGDLLRPWLLPTEQLRGMTAPISPGPTAVGARSPPEAAVAAYGAPNQEPSPNCRKATNWGDGESCPGGGHCLWRTCRGRQPPAGRAWQLGGSGSPAQAAVAAYETILEDGNPSRPTSTSWGDGDFRRGGGRCLRRACWGQQLLSARGHQLRGRGVLPRRRLLPMGHLQGTAATISAG